MLLGITTWTFILVFILCRMIHVTFNQFFSFKPLLLHAMFCEAFLGHTHYDTFFQLTLTTICCLIVAPNLCV